MSQYITSDCSKQEKSKMSKMMNSLVVASCMLSTTAFAGAIDGKRDAICAVTDVVGCTEGAVCIQGNARDFDLPNFAVLDAKKKVIRATYESGHKHTSPIKNMQKDGTHLVLQGVENSRGWSIAIDTKTGHMSASGVGAEVGFLMFGACTAL
jgi:hypothetical protein